MSAIPFFTPIPVTVPWREREIDTQHTQKKCKSSIIKVHNNQYIIINTWCGTATDTQRLGGDVKGTASPAIGKSELPAARGRIAPLPTKT